MWVLMFAEALRTGSNHRLMPTARKSLSCMRASIARRRHSRSVRLQSSPPAKIAKLRNTMTCPAMSLQHPIKSRCSHAVRIQVPIGESMMAVGAMNSHAHHGTEDEQLDGEERLIADLSWLRLSCVRRPSSHRYAHDFAATRGSIPWLREARARCSASHSIPVSGVP